MMSWLPSIKTVLYASAICKAAISYGLDQPAEARLAEALDQRYAPYADWGLVLDPADLHSRKVDRYWKTIDTIKMERKPEALPLSGLHLALDPGHIGGEWASIEARNFRIEREDHYVREGQLVLVVARAIRDRLVRLGADVTLLRESAKPVNTKIPFDYLDDAIKRVGKPATLKYPDFKNYAQSVITQAERLAFVTGDLWERARLVNEVIRPDALISLHINAAPWPLDPDSGEELVRLIDSNHLHVLIFGCLSDHEIGIARQRDQLLVKLLNGSGPEEARLGGAIAREMALATALPASSYSGKNAVLLDPNNNYLWARNLMLLRYVECPTVLLEPYVANSKGAYPRIQEAIERRAKGLPPKADDILLEYANGVVEGILKTYASDG